MHCVAAHCLAPWESRHATNLDRCLSLRDAIDSLLMNCARGTSLLSLIVLRALCSQRNISLWIAFHDNRVSEMQMIPFWRTLRFGHIFHYSNWFHDKPFTWNASLFVAVDSLVTKSALPKYAMHLCSVHFTIISLHSNWDAIDSLLTNYALGKY